MQKVIAKNTVSCCVLFDNPQSYHQDYHASSNTMPTMDDSQDWELLYSAESGGYTSLKFKRALRTCDDNDVVINVSLSA